MGNFYSPLTTLLTRNPIPLIVMPTFTGGAAGAITLGTSISHTYPKGFGYFGAGTLEIGQPAGWYYVEMSSDTAGVVYNNTYTPAAGVNPEIPTSPTSFASAIVGGAGIATSVPVYVTSIPANALGDRGVMSFDGTLLNTGSFALSFSLTFDGDDIYVTSMTAPAIFLSAATVYKGTEFVTATIKATPLDGFLLLSNTDTTVANNVALSVETADPTNFCVIFNYSIEIDNR